MEYERDVTIAERTVRVRELSVRDIRTLLKPNSNKEVDVIAESLMDDVSFDIIAAMTDLDVADLEDMKPSQISQVVESCREVNQSFFSMIKKWLDANSEAGGAT